MGAGVPYPHRLCCCLKFAVVVGPAAPRAVLSSSKGGGRWMRQAALALTVSVALVTATGLAGAAGAERAGGVAPIPDGRAGAASRLAALGAMAGRGGAGAGVRGVGLCRRAQAPTPRTR